MSPWKSFRLGTTLNAAADVLFFFFFFFLYTNGTILLGKELRVMQANTFESTRTPVPTDRCLYKMLKIKIPIHVFHLLSMSNKSNSSDISFEPFFQEWLAKQKYYLNQLLFLSSSQNQPSKQEDLQALVGQVLSHYQDYYEAKSRVARKNVFTLFSPPWFSTYERSFLWVAGFKPGISFNILDRSVGKELTAQQNESVDRLKQETRASEKTLSGEMAKIQDSIAGPTWVQMAMTSEKLVADEELDQVVETARYRLRDLVVSADLLRAKTTRELVEILSTVQAAKFLAATARFQFKVRTLGLRRDAQRSVGK